MVLSVNNWCTQQYFFHSQFVFAFFVKLMGHPPAQLVSWVVYCNTKVSNISIILQYNLTKQFMKIKYLSLWSVSGFSASFTRFLLLNVSLLLSLLSEIFFSFVCFWPTIRNVLNMKCNKNKFVSQFLNKYLTIKSFFKVLGPGVIYCRSAHCRRITRRISEPLIAKVLKAEWRSRPQYDYISAALSNQKNYESRTTKRIFPI